MTRHEFVRQLIPGLTAAPGTCGTGSAPVNIALAKYWGKRDSELNLPRNSSLSVALPSLGTRTRVILIDGPQDRVTLNGQPAPEGFTRRLSAWLDLFRPAGAAFEVETENSVPTAAGLASSASGFAALARALDDLFDWQLDARTLSMLARIGSGSASRSLFDGFAVWHRGERDDGLDSWAEPLPQRWPALRIGLVEVDVTQKPVGSTAGMTRTVDTCPLYDAWPDFAERCVRDLTAAIEARDMEKLGEIAEHNALTMHATMIATRPPVLYWIPESVAAMQRVWALRQAGTGVWFTMDAGPNLKLLFEADARPAVVAAFPDLRIIAPFAP
ncbi:diphosphomevalonate decarboxylase [Sulfurivirga sp.]|uniref:diphosphomevalonate decarboxylase n=1 Tax=Sulfurivirga sp. TaxID=2614236 RepID=UPI0025D8F29C|nr:diphosphomevalonate decarboxylase [Sulfurivirga sp.]